MSNAKTMTIADVMTKSVISVDSSVTAGDAAKMMEDAKVGTVIVMENNAPVGIVTDRDFAAEMCIAELKFWQSQRKNWDDVIMSYNAGWRKENGRKYLKEIREKMAHFA